MVENTRISPRFPLEATAGMRLYVEGEEREYLSLSLRDISRTGAYLRTINPPPLGSYGHIEIVLRFPLLGDILGNDRTALVTRVQVVRVDDEGIWVQFDHEGASMELALH